jgi:transcriptional regulator with XRE-family HTH domain
MKIVGINIKRLREQKNITLRELAKKAGVSASFISQIETGKVSPSLVTLKNIAKALNITVSSLIGEEHPKASDCVLRESEREVINHIGNGIKMYVLTSPDPNKQMEPLLFKLDKKADSGNSSYKHFGQEFVIVLKGVLQIMLNETKYVLKKGDSIYFNSTIPHSFKNLASQSTEALWVVTPPTF